MQGQRMLMDVVTVSTVSRQCWNQHTRRSYIIIIILLYYYYDGYDKNKRYRSKSLGSPKQFHVFFENHTLILQISAVIPE